MRRMHVLACVSVGLWTVGCGKDTTDGGDSGSVTAYSAMIDLFEQSCGAGCHMDGSSFGNLALDEADAAANLVDMPAAGDSSWMRVVCGDVGQSALYQKLMNPAPFGDPMPLGVSLTDSEMAVIQAWIESDECGE